MWKMAVMTGCVCPDLAAATARAVSNVAISYDRIRPRGMLLVSRLGVPPGILANNYSPFFIDARGDGSSVASRFGFCSLRSE
jgi:hypothetical protein